MAESSSSAAGHAPDHGRDASSERDPLDLLTEQFLQARRRGETLEVETFAAQHPAHQAALLELLPTLLALERMKRDRESTGGQRARVRLPAMAQLGDFRIVGEVGRGGMGVVFEAVQESLGRKVALKVLPQAALLTDHQLQRFRREAQTAAQLHHSNIVPVFGSGESDGYHWYAMQCIAGASLDRWRADRAAAPPADASAWRTHAAVVARFGLQAAAALHYAHEQGTLHRDVKPGNLLLEQNGHLWVTDFGLAKALEAEGLTHSGDLLGTLQYMAPEQFAGHYDVRSEVYALGVTLYELLVLRPAFAARTRSELIECIRTRPPEALRRARPELPLDLVRVVEKAMARESRDRYASARELELDLLAFLEDRPVAARPLGAMRQLARWCRRNRVLASLAASTLLAVVGAGAVGWWSYATADRARQDAQLSAGEAVQQRNRADKNLALALAWAGEMFDGLIGRDPLLDLDEDPDTGEATMVARAVVDPHNVEVLQSMLRFYDQFAAQNEHNEALAFETARAWRRVGAIHARLGGAEHFLAAQAAYEQAQQRFGAITTRDVTREIAAIQVELGQLAHQRADLGTAEQRFQDALQLLAKGGESRALWFERATTHYLLAQLVEPAGSGRPQGGPNGPNGPGGPGSRDLNDLRRDWARLFDAAKPHLQQALEILDRLLADEPEHREYQRLRARCLLLGSRLAGRAAEGPGQGQRSRDPRTLPPEVESQRREGLELLRRLLQGNPEDLSARFELTRELLPERRFDERRGGPPGRQRRDERPLDDAELALLREAKGHADRLVAAQPQVAEYHALRLRAIVALARDARLRAEAAGAQEPQARRAEALGWFTGLGAAERVLLFGAAGGNGRLQRLWFEVRLEQALLLAGNGDKAAALEIAQGVCELLERQFGGEGRPAGAGGPPPGLGGPGEAGLVGRLRGLVEALAVPELQQRWQRLEVRLRERGPGERGLGGERPGEGRPKGR
ncbi:MAG: serine/threonine protein kinase [Planctomycetes bacterium]|nr:serine/threonine protein kinase [Planctomycetota bacterium]